jgi:hypothetical protein
MLSIFKRKMFLKIQKKEKPLPLAQAKIKIKKQH